MSPERKTTILLIVGKEAKNEAKDSESVRCLSRFKPFLRRSGNRRGNNLVEFTFLLPWYIFLFVGSLDFGFYAYSLIAVQNAARVSALYCSRSATTSADSTTACSYALDQLKYLPNIGSGTTTCVSPVTVTAQLVSGPDGHNATSVTVNYITPNLIPIPGIVVGQMRLSRTTVVRLRT